MTDWREITRRNSRSVQTTIGWIFWDPEAVEGYAAAGLPQDLAGPLGYMAARCAPLAAAGPAAVVAALGSISPLGIHALFGLLEGPGRFEGMRLARDAAVVKGLRRYAPDILEPLIEFGPELWDAVDNLPLMGRVFFGVHLALPRPKDPILSGWYAINCIREWRGDTHWALVVSEGLSHAEASILHNAWLGYEGDWLAISRGTTTGAIDAGWTALASRGLATDRMVGPEGIALRQRIEDDTERLTTLPWELIGEARAIEFAERFEPPCAFLLSRVDQTAGTNYQPASRIR